MPKISLAVTLVLLLINIALLTVASYINSQDISLNIEKNKLQQVGHYGYLADLNINSKNKFYVRGDSRSHPNRSQLTLFIDDAALPYPHAVYNEIVGKGGGRYRHQKKNTLLFSLPDNRLRINQIESISAKIKLAFPQDIIKASVSTLIISILILIYKLLLTSPIVPSASTYIRRILQLFLATCFVLYLLHIFRLMPALITLTADTIYYFAPALSFINNGVLDLLSGPSEQGHTFGFIYPLLLVIFTSGGSLNHIPFVQALLLLVTVWVFFYLVRYATKGDSLQNHSTIIGLLACICMISYFVYTKYTVEIMPEIVYQLSSILTVYMLSLVISKKLSFNQLAIYCGAIIFFVSFNIHVKPHGAALFVLVWTCVVIRILFIPPASKFKIPLLVTLAFLAVALFHYPNSYLNQHNAPGKTYGPRTLVCNHVNLIEPVIEKHIHNQDAAAFLRADFEKTLNAPNDWKILGFSGDHCLFNLQTTQVLAEKLDLTLPQQADLYAQLFISGILHNPLAYFSKVIKQYRYAISHPYPGRNSIVGRTEGSSYLNALVRRDDFQCSGLDVAFNQAFYNHPLLINDFDLSWPGRALLNMLHHLGVYIFLLFMTLLLIDVCRVIRKKLQFDVFLKLWYLPVFSLVIYLASLSVVALAHSFDVSRYIQFCSTYALYFQLCAISVFWYKFKIVQSKT